LAVSLAYASGEEGDNFLVQQTSNEFYLPWLRVEEGGGVGTLWSFPYFGQIESEENLVKSLSLFLKVWLPLGAVLPAGLLPPAGGSPPLLLLPWLGGRKVCLTFKDKIN
jgi:hypothetical protein